MHVGISYRLRWFHSKEAWLVLFWILRLSSAEFSVLEIEHKTLSWPLLIIIWFFWPLQYLDGWQMQDMETMQSCCKNGIDTLLFIYM